MKVIGEPISSVFPMKVKCQHVTDCNGYGYGNKPDFCGRELEIEETDVKKHPWFKYPNDTGVDYGIVCPVCKMFTMLDSSVLPSSVKENAREISLTHGKYCGSIEDL